MKQQKKQLVEDLQKLCRSFNFKGVQKLLNDPSNAPVIDSMKENEELGNICDVINELGLAETILQKESAGNIARFLKAKFDMDDPDSLEPSEYRRV